MRSGAAWTILRMGYYAEALAAEAQMALAHGVLAALSPERVSFVARDDLAAAAAGMLAGDGHNGAVYQGTGPAALSGEERAATIAAVAGKPLAFLQISAEQMHQGLDQAGLPADVVDAVLDIQGMFAAGGFDVVSGDIERLSGRPPRPLTEALAGLLG